jgi:hypothetical protein
MNLTLTRVIPSQGERRKYKKIIEIKKSAFNLMTKENILHVKDRNFEIRMKVFYEHL